MYFRTRKWNVVGWFKIVSAISYAVIIAGLLVMGYNWVTKGYPLKLGLSFTGGTDVTAKFEHPVTTQEIRTALGTIGVSDAQINTLGSPSPGGADRYSISTQTAFGNSPQQLWNALATAAPIDQRQSQIASVGPSLSREYLIKALLALVIAIGIQFVYIAFRFGWNYIFGLVVVIALVRDALMMIGIYAISGKRADDAFLAAVLTVIGYSVMDTIVILDRIRENVKVMAGESYETIVNTSILQTMTRSLNTLATVVITLVALLAFGGASLQNFAFALLVGIVSGGYHSIFYSAPLVAVLRERQLRRDHALNRGSADKPRTVADAKAQASRDRTEILAARKERRAREKTVPVRGAAPARYRRKRATPLTPQERAALTPAEAAEEDRLDREQDLETLAGDHEESALGSSLALDPLDAQRAGAYDEHLTHEEINLSFDDEQSALEDRSHNGEAPATAPHH